MKIEKICNNTVGLYNKESDAYSNLKKCIRQHQLLVRYIDEIDSLYRYISLCQLLSFVVQICFSGFQLLLVSIVT